MSAAQRDLLTPIEYPAAFPAVFPAQTEAQFETGIEAKTETEAEAPFALKEQVAQRLAAHRARRTHPSDPASVPAIVKPGPAKARSARIAATVAERYANSPSYRAFLAAEAENAIRAAQAASREAEAAAEVAAISAKAVADAQYELLAELDHWTLTAPPPPTPEPAPAASFPSTFDPSQAARPSSTHGLTVRLYDDPTRSTPQPASSRIQPWEPLDEAEGIALDDEIAFRQSPIFEDYTSASELPANLIEFPRQLIAARRARPRLAEGPLREDLSPTSDAAQLRIFEVEASQISTAPSAGSAYSPEYSLDSPHSPEPEWSSILLAAHPVSPAAASAEALLNPLFADQFFPQPAPQTAPQPAPLSLRLTATLVDACILVAAFLAFVAAFAITSGKVSARLYPTQPLPAIASLLSRHTAAPQTAIAALATLAIFALLYQLLFFTFSEATPGMRYARIGLCTFSDENPTRRSMRRRLFAVLLAACPLGIGFLWAWLDEEGLGWHDRLSRMYQRSY